MPIPIPLKFMKIGFNTMMGTVVSIDEVGVHLEIRMNSKYVNKRTAEWDGELQVVYIIPNENNEFNPNDEDYKIWKENYDTLVSKWMKANNDENSAHETRINQLMAEFNKDVKNL